MTSERWTLIARIYDSVIEAPASKRAALLDVACSDDGALRQEVESLLAQDTRSSPIDEPVWDTVASVLNTEAPHLQHGQRIGPYLVEDVIGRGGMGEVYRARDTNLGRNVALKVLPRGWSTDAERLARFRREAQTLAALNHPNIAIIHGFEQGVDGSVQALVMELVEGPTLADRIASGPIPVDEALPIARQIADALEAAHEQNIVHRDLKPANIKLRPDGTIKVLDFGLAKPVPSVSPEDPSVSPTITTPAVTGAGVILGTAAYMSPEQAKGRAADRRADIWAFGCVLYEMLTGSRAFHGEDVSETLAAVLRGEPDWNQLPADTTPALRRLLKRCLTKSLRDRLQHIGDARFELAESADGVSEAPRPNRARERAAWSIAGVCAVAMLAAVVAWVAKARSSAPFAPEMRVEIPTAPTADPLSMALSPDGTQIVFAASAADHDAQLWLRPLASTRARPLDGTERSRYPFWSPDSRSIAFFADGRLKRLDITSGSIQVIATAIAGYGGSWSGRDVIVFAPSGGASLLRVDSRGGQPTAVTQHAVGPGHRMPFFLPDGEHFLFYASQDRSVYVGGLASSARRLIDADAAAVYVPGYLLYSKQRRLFAQPFDPERLELSGDPLLVTEEVTVSTEAGIAAISPSSSGAIAYRSGRLTAPSRQLVWVDRAGKTLATVGPPAGELSVDPVLSLDDRHVALWRTQNGNPDVWLLDALDGRRVRLTTEPSADMFPIWSPDGARIAFGSGRTGKSMEIYVRSVTGQAPEQLVVSNGDYNFPLDWSQDSQFILYGKAPPSGPQDIYAIHVADKLTAVPVAVGSFDERQAQFSPDGRWVAYQSNESGRFEVYAQPFPGPGTKIPVSTNGGTQVRWRSDGQELFFLAPDDRIMSVPIRIASGTVFEAGTPRGLFPVHLNDTRAPGNFRQQYAVSRDGRSFLLNTLIEEQTNTPITLLLNRGGISK